MKAVLLALLVLGAAVVLLPVADAGPNCYEIYHHYDFDPVDVYQYSSCSYAVCVYDDCNLLR